MFRRSLKGLYRTGIRLLRLHREHAWAMGDKFVWRTFNLETGTWEYRQMTDSEHQEAFCWWAIQ